MKIKVAILERDVAYLNRITSIFSLRYAEKLEVYAFTTYEGAMKALENTRIDVLLADDCFEIEKEKLPKRCGMAYLVDMTGIESIRDCTAICKFQKADIIYKQILGVYAEKAESMTGIAQEDCSCKIIAFMSPAGGTGTSSMAEGCAMRYAQMGISVLYLNLEKFNTGDEFFSGEGQFNMSDIIFALKGRKTNLTMKLESCVKRDESGVNFFAKARIPLDMLEVGPEDLKELLTALKNTESYQILILDMDFALGKEFMQIQGMMHKIVMVSDGEATANFKILQALESLQIIERNQEMPFMHKFAIAYNRFRSDGGNVLEQIPIPMLGGAPVYRGAAPRQIAQQLSLLSFWDELLETA